jgi:hypothetical protein
MNRIAIIASLYAVVGLTACKDFTASGDPLTQAEANALAEAIMNEGFPGTGGVGTAPAAAPGAQAAPADRITITLNTSGPCEGGGTVGLAGSMTFDGSQQTQTGTLEYDFTMTPNACVVTAEGNKTFTLTGDPNLRAEGSMDFSPTGFQGDFTYKGKFAWTSSDGRAGACGVNLESHVAISGNGTSGTASATLTGSVCGVTVNKNVTIDA